MKSRAGFTLVETVVTVGLMAVLAAFVVPSVLRRADSADPVKVASDLNAISTAVLNFSQDLKGALPGDLEDLTTPLLVNSSCTDVAPCDSTITHREIYTAKEALRWAGPYMNASISANPESSLRSGFIVEIVNRLLRFDAFNGVPEFCSLPGQAWTTCTGFVGSNPLFVSARLNGLNARQALLVNDILDGPNEEQPGLEGRFRYHTPGSPAYFLVAPVPNAGTTLTPSDTSS